MNEDYKEYICCNFLIYIYIIFFLNFIRDQKQFKSNTIWLNKNYKKTYTCILVYQDKINLIKEKRYLTKFFELSWFGVYLLNKFDFK